jgi:hypothetical protein
MQFRLLYCWRKTFLQTSQQMNHILFLKKNFPVYRRVKNFNTVMAFLSKTKKLFPSTLRTCWRRTRSIQWSLREKVYQSYTTCMDSHFTRHETISSLKLCHWVSSNEMCFIKLRIELWVNSKGGRNSITGDIFRGVTFERIRTKVTRQISVYLFSGIRNNFDWWYLAYGVSTNKIILLTL